MSADKTKARAMVRTIPCMPHVQEAKVVLMFSDIDFYCFSRPWPDAPSSQVSTLSELRASQIEGLSSACMYCPFWQRKERIGTAC